MAISRAVKIIVTVVIIAILLGVIIVESRISSSTNTLVVSDVTLTPYWHIENEFLIVNANITNIGRANVTNIVLLIQTYYENGTESANWNMTLWQNVTVPAIYSPVNPVNVTINAGQSYLVRSGNWLLTEDIEHPITANGYPVVDYHLQDTNFFAHYK